jgi:hypothetical protein
MLTHTQQHHESFDPSLRGRVRRTGAAMSAVVLAALLAATLVAAAPVSAQPPPAGTTMYVHSAASGELRGGRLILHGVSGKVSWAHMSGRSGVMAVKRLHRRLFSAGASATGTLHVAGHHGGDEPTFRLSNPRYSPARRTVSYKVRRLGEGRLPGSGDRARGAARRFGASSLSMIAVSSSGAVVWNPQASVYPCASGTGTCWGTLTVYGLDPGAGVNVTRQWSDGGMSNDGYPADQGGRISGKRLELPCTGYDRYVGAVYFDPDGPELDAPDQCRSA